jgi:hypothetical protein
VFKYAKAKASASSTVTAYSAYFTGILQDLHVTISNYFTDKEL